MGRGRGRSHGGSDNRAATVSPDDVTPRKPGELVVGWGGCNERERERDEKETNTLSTLVPRLYLCTKAWCMREKEVRKVNERALPKA